YDTAAPSSVLVQVTDYHSDWHGTETDCKETVAQMILELSQLVHGAPAFRIGEDIDEICSGR
ncbi:MAG TPA: hypothetical protein VNG12_19555, partial [Acidimicrobiales bacterium]|nr:hypothetical protein [Acidimicrobiales bacterium]